MSIPTPKELLVTANAVTNEPAYRLIDYGEVIFALRHKKYMTWSAVAVWFRERGFISKGQESTQNTVKHAFHAWRRREGYGPVAYDADGDAYLKKLKPVKEKVKKSTAKRKVHTHCQSQGDGECPWEGCPQIRDDEPFQTSRICPLPQPADH